MRGFVLLGVVGLVCAGCAPRGQLATLPSDQSVPSDTTLHEILVATTRAETDEGQVFSNTRGQDLSFARFEMSVPPTHVPGKIEWPRQVPDPETDFIVKDAARLNGTAAFEQRLSQALQSRPSSEQNALIFVHGYNTNFAESLYRFAQAHHDYQSTNVPILFTWASSASTVGYLYDRDSVLVARDALVDLLETVEKSRAKKVSLIAHSMGTFLVMEALRQIALSDDRSALDRVSEVVLLSPDIAVEVFETQIRTIGDLPQSFVVISSQADQALRVSNDLTQKSGRLGTLDDPTRFEDFEITFVDLTALAEIGSLNHLGGIESGVQIERIRKLAAFSDNLNADALEASGSTVVQTFNRAVEVTLQPETAP